MAKCTDYPSDNRSKYKKTTETAATIDGITGTVCYGGWNCLAGICATGERYMVYDEGGRVRAFSVYINAFGKYTRGTQLDR